MPKAVLVMDMPRKRGKHLRQCVEYELQHGSSRKEKVAKTHNR